MKTRSLAPALALAALLSVLVPPPEARAEPEKPADKVEGAWEWEEVDAQTIAEARARSERETVARRIQLEKELPALRAKVAELTGTLGPEHLDTLAARRAVVEQLHRLGFNLGEDDQRREYEEERRAVFDLAVRVHGAGNPATFGDWKWLALACEDRGDYKQAVKEFRVLLAAMEKTVGPEDGEAFHVRRLLAFLFYMTRQEEEAEREFRALLALSDRVPDLRLHYVRELRRALAEGLERQGKYAEAETEYRLYVAALDAKKADELMPGDYTSFPRHSARVSLAKCLLAQGKAAEALRELEFIQAHRAEDDVVGRPEDESFAALLEKTRKALAESGEENPAPAPAKPE